MFTLKLYLWQVGSRVWQTSWGAEVFKSHSSWATDHLSQSCNTPFLLLLQGHWQRNFGRTKWAYFLSSAYQLISVCVPGIQEQRRHYEVAIYHGKLYYQSSGELVHTPDTDRWIFVMSPSYKLYIGKVGQVPCTRAFCFDPNLKWYHHSCSCYPQSAWSENRNSTLEAHPIDY